MPLDARTTRTCAHASCYGALTPDGTWQACDWTPDPTTRKHVDTQAEAHVKATGHPTETRIQPAEDCDVHRTRP